MANPGRSRHHVAIGELQRCQEFLDNTTTLDDLTTDDVGPSTSSTSTLPVVADPAQANGFLSSLQASGRLPGLPDGPLYVDIEQFAAGQGPPATLTRDCIIYVPSGTQAILESSGVGLSATAAFVGPDGASYPRTGDIVSGDAFCLRPSSDRAQGAVIPGAKSIFTSADFSDLTAPGPYLEQLSLVEIQHGGRRGAHIHSGPETLLGYGGTTTYRLGGPTPVNVNGRHSPVTQLVGQAMTHAANQPIQDFNTGDGVAQALAFIVWPADQPVRTKISSLP